MDQAAAVIIGISGCSSSGKTTLARLLRDLFPNTFILHEDDFYRPENELPIKEGLVDWDSIDSLTIPDMEAALSHIRTCGTFPPNVDSKEDQNTTGPTPLTPTQLEAAKAKVDTWLAPGQPGHEIFYSANRPPLRICLLDGFLLYAEEMRDSIIAKLTIKLFLRVSHAKAKQRREARDGYVTLEGFWKDPPGYVDKIVWPNYVEAHKWLFEYGDVEGTVNESIMGELGIQTQSQNEVDVAFGETFDWAVEAVMRGLEERWRKHRI